MTGYYHVDNQSAFNALTTTFAGTPLISDNGFEREDFTQELRLNTNFPNPLNFTAGGFYQYATVTNDSNQLGNTLYNLPALLGRFRHNLTIEAVSLFGQANWQATPELEISGGARWTDEKRGNRPFSLTSGVKVPFTIARPTISASNLSPEFTITYIPNDDLTLFASYKKGFKSGSFDLNSLSRQGTDIAFDDEEVEGGEVGLKARLFDRRLTLNLAGYYYEYRGLQVGSSEPDEDNNNLPLVRTLNAGAARVYGIDFDLAYRPSGFDGLNIFFAGAWNNARFTRLEGVPCSGGQTIAQGCDQFFNPVTGRFTAQSLSGQPLVRAPDWQLNFGFDYETRIGRNLDLAFSNANQYSSRYLAGLGQRDDLYQGAFFKFDASLAIRDLRERWELALIGKNLGGELTTGSCNGFNAANAGFFGGQITGGTTRGPAGVDEIACIFDRGREVNIRLTIRPFG